MVGVVGGGARGAVQGSRVMRRQGSKRRTMVIEGKGGCVKQGLPANENLLSH